jgi:hypothetical protein
MGQAKRRKQKLGALYGTPEGSNQPLILYRGFNQQDCDRKALGRIQSAMAAGIPVILMGTADARPLAAAAGLPWLHEILSGEPIPNALAWDPTIAEAGGPLLPPGHGQGGLFVMGAGSGEWLKAAIADPMGTGGLALSLAGCPTAPPPPHPPRPPKP